MVPSPSHSHDGQAGLSRDKLQHGGQGTPGGGRGPLLLVHQPLQGARRQQLTQLGQQGLRTAVVYLETGGGDEGSSVPLETEDRGGGSSGPLTPLLPARLDRKSTRLNSSH